MAKATDININLAKNRGESFLDRFIGFALTIGRVLIIVTELIALAAFLYRFTLDRTLSDLHDRITQQEAVVNLLKDNESTFRNIQARLSLANALTKQGNQLPSYLQDVVSFAPVDMNIQTIAVATDAIRIEATVQSVDSLTHFVDKLKLYAPIASVSIDKIDNQTLTGTIIVSITATLKKQKPIPGTTAGINGTAPNTTQL